MQLYCQSCKTVKNERYPDKVEKKRRNKDSQHSQEHTLTNRKIFTISLLL